MPKIKAKPIIFSSEMVNAVLKDRKTQIRKVVKSQPFNSRAKYQGLNSLGDYLFYPDDSWNDNEEIIYDTDNGLRKCPYGKIGDKLWVRETWINYQTVDHHTYAEISDGAAEYKANGFDNIDDFKNHFKLMDYVENEDDVITKFNHWQSPVTMPRWASRITLEITSIRVERLQDISNEDAKEEGCKHPLDGDPDRALIEANADYIADERTSFAILWNRIKGQDSWNQNPFVWCLTFKRIPY